MSSILSIAASGMVAAATRLQISAENVANAKSDGPLPTAGAAVQAQYPAAYTAQQVDQVAAPGGGTSAAVVAVQPATIAAYAPAALYADKNGEVAAPNVDPANEAMQQATASYTFAMNVEVMRVYSQMMKTLLDVQA
ncbi:MAG: flagellar basal body rod C-terminal domain-containing protein [Xanthobacteraceae bacterium]